ncbi:MAG: T9SS type A sorting domain-containing protein [Putridiphycobacter sp.]
MKKIFFIFCFSFTVLFGQSLNDTIYFDSEREMTDFAYGNLNDSIYNYCLLNRCLNISAETNLKIENPNRMTSIIDWLRIYQDVFNSYSDTTKITSIFEMVENLNDFFYELDHDFIDNKQPFMLLLQNVNYIDSSHFVNGDILVQNDQYYCVGNEEELYDSLTINGVAVFENYYNSTNEGYLVYDPSFFVMSQDISLLSIEINTGDGSGYQEFSELNPEIKYEVKDTTIASARVKYSIGDSVFTENFKFYLNTLNRGNRSVFGNDWDVKKDYDPLPGNDLKYRVGIKFGCDNPYNGTIKYKRPIIISPPYRPPVQAYFWLEDPAVQDYWDQFNIANLYDEFVALGYDVVFIRQNHGNESIEIAGDELAEFIIYINHNKELYYPHEDWENIVMGYSAGGLSARYALMKLEKEHMDYGWSHPHTRLYIPFDSPHEGANVPMFTQLVYKEFRYSNVFAALAYNSLVDNASKDMGGYHVDGSDFNTNGDFIYIDPKPNIYHINLENEYQNNFIHSYSHTSDLRRKYPTFCRNVGVSTGSYKNKYDTEFGLGEGDLMFKQHGISYTPLTIVNLNITHAAYKREIWSSEYGPEARSFYRNDAYYFIAMPVYAVNHKYVITEGLEFDNSQGGYKTQFYSSFPTGATVVLRFTGGMLGERYYDGEMNFLPLVSALGINPNIWKTNNVNGSGQLYYNLQSYLMFRINYNPNDNSYTTTDNYGYPHLGHPTNHFNITPFEAVYADVNTYDHIVMKSTVEDYDNVTYNDLDRLKGFLVDEVEPAIYPLQNQVVGHNHIHDGNFEYKAWYKARQSIEIGNHVTARTEPGDYIIEATGNINVRAKESIDIKPGFHAQAGCVFHAKIQSNGFCDFSPFNATTQNNNQISKSQQTEVNSNKENSQEHVFENAKVLENKIIELKLYPNPNSGLFTFEVNHSANVNGQIFVYSLTGQLVFQQNVTTNKTQLHPSLEKGVYVVEYKTNDFSKTLKMIVQ